MTLDQKRNYPKRSCLQSLCGGRFGLELGDAEGSARLCDCVRP